MISAGKVSATTIERSRTTDGCRGSGTDAIARASPRRRRATGVEVQLGDEDLVLARRAARSRRLPARADRRQPTVGVRRRSTRAACPATRNGVVAGSNRARHAERVAQPLDDALDVEEIDLAGRRRPVFGAADPGPGDADAARFARRP